MRIGMSSTEENLWKTDNQQEASNPDSLLKKILTPTSEFT
ncbi:hypothetical protein cce_1628 [Crocosphaera subtropica ATCC 51142]|uniref:Uncharacterized protein n=1 Tax=Crocosphaera subtropica (strain ATCC 51142 / BH68) TaxID=43989 RepID=B1WXZ1_CROS5|nr:hypothetical protein cce_1628 [Crocosphaera subtropica ATCC 51142]